MHKIESKIVGYRVIKGEGSESSSLDEKIIPTDVKLPDDSPARMKVLKAEGKKWYLTVVSHKETDQPFALFCRTNSHEKSAQTSDAVERLFTLARKKGIAEEHIASTETKVAHESNVDKLTRAISLLLRHGVLIRNIVAELNQMDDVFVGSFLFQVRKFLSQYVKDGEKVDGAACTECGSTAIMFSEGCQKCLSCGSSKCG